MTINSPSTEFADLVLKNGRVFTQEAEPSQAQAVAVAGKRIVYVGDNRGAADFIGPQTQVIDLDGKMVLPAFIDAHMHPVHGAYRYVYCLSLFGINADDLKQAYLEEARRFVVQNPDKPWIQGAGFRRGCDGGDWRCRSWLETAACGQCGAGQCQP